MAHQDRTTLFAIAGSPDSIDRVQMSGLLCLGSTAAVSHEAAARLHAFDRCRPDVVEFTMPRVGRGRKVPFVVHTTDALGPPDVVTVNGFRCTSATRTIIDLARARIPAVRLEAAIDSAVRSGASSPSSSPSGLLPCAVQAGGAHPGSTSCSSMPAVIRCSSDGFSPCCARHRCRDRARKSSTVPGRVPSHGSTSASRSSASWSRSLGDEAT